MPSRSRNVAVFFCSDKSWKVVTSLPHSSLGKEGLQPKLIQEIYGSEKVKTVAASASVEVGSSQLSSTGLYVGLLRGGVCLGCEDLFSRWELVGFQSLSLDKLRDWLDFVINDWLVCLLKDWLVFMLRQKTSVQGQCVSLTLVLGSKYVSLTGFCFRSGCFFDWPFYHTHCGAHSQGLLTTEFENK